MASSLQTLIKILHLEEQKGYQNKAVIGGFGRFAYHWAKEAHNQAKTDEHHTIVDEVVHLLRNYEAASEDARPAVMEEIIALATGQAEAVAAAPPSPPPTPVTKESIPPDLDMEPALPQTDSTEDLPPIEGEEFDFLFEDEDTTESSDHPAEQTSVRKRRGYHRRPSYTPDEVDLEGLYAPVTALKGVGAKRLEQFGKLGVETIGDLINLYPRRYDDYTKLRVIQDLQFNEIVTVIGTIENVNAVAMRRGSKRIEAQLKDLTGTLRLNWFNQPWMERQLVEGEPVVLSGKVEQYLGRLVMNSPEIEALEQEWLNTGRIVPVYPLTKGLTGKAMRKQMKVVVNEWTQYLPDILPLSVRENLDLMDFGDAVNQIHFPDSPEDLTAAQTRLAFEELFMLNMRMLQWRHEWQARAGQVLAVEDAWVEDFTNSLPYTLTNAQQKAFADIRQGIANDLPMNRLLQGDVGSGKTVVSAMAMGIAAANGVQSAFMAPTSILAEQHYNNLLDLFENAPGGLIPIALLTGNTPQAEKDQIYEALASGEILIAIGTHALIQEPVTFANLGLVVIDEQHRFGVDQRGILRDKATQGNPHLLVTTATPIPRTLALTLHADLDLSIIDEMPPGREPIETRAIQQKERERAYAFIRGQVSKGHQVFIIYPLVDESDKLDAKAAVPEYERLQSTIFPNLRLGLLHGQMKASEKESVMDDFYRGEIDILVSTTVIEVGIDVPNATVMMVENANRFGLAQLHQLRGRVGRGGHKGYCLLVSNKSFLDKDDRLSAMESTTDGFKLAEIDWELRGAGDLLGTQQSGFAVNTFTEMINQKLVEQVQQEARRLYEFDPGLDLPEHSYLAERVRQVAQQGDIS